MPHHKGSRWSWPLAPTVCQLSMLMAPAPSSPPPAPSSHQTFCYQLLQSSHAVANHPQFLSRRDDSPKDTTRSCVQLYKQSMSTSNIIDFEELGLTPFLPLTPLPRYGASSPTGGQSQSRTRYADQQMYQPQVMLNPFSPPKAPQLPPGWIEMQNPDGRVFYYHQQSNTSHWNIPGVPTSQGHCKQESSYCSPFRMQRARGEDSGPSFTTLSDLSADDVSLVVRVFQLMSSAAL